jgi:hypothetical protein
LIFRVEPAALDRTRSIPSTSFIMACAMKNKLVEEQLEEGRGTLSLARTNRNITYAELLRFHAASARAKATPMTTCPTYWPTCWIWGLLTRRPVKSP